MSEYNPGFLKEGGGIGTCATKVLITMLRSNSFDRSTVSERQNCKT